MVTRRACVNCTTAKSKCTPHSARQCQRCARLGKNCVFLELPERRRKPRHGESNSRVVALERRINDLTSQLSAITRERRPPISIANSREPRSDSTGISDTVEIDAEIAAEVINADCSVKHDWVNDSAAAPRPIELFPDVVDRGLLGLEEAEALIQTFRIQHVPRFPFVGIPADQSAATLKQQHPFLFQCIIAATAHPAHPIHRQISEDIMQQITAKVIQGSESSLDLAHGLLVCCAWHRHPAQQGHMRLVLLTQLCITVVYDLELHRKDNMTLSEQRLLLGVYWLSIGLQHNMHRPVAMKHTKQIDKCHDSLTLSVELASDPWIRPFIDLQLFVSKINANLSLLDEASGSPAGDGLLKIITEQLMKDFASLKLTIKQEIIDFPTATVNTFLADLQYIEVSILTIALEDKFWAATQMASLAVRHSITTSTFRTALLWNLIKKSKDYVEIILKTPEEELLRCTTFHSARLCTAIVSIPRAVVTLMEIMVALDASQGNLSPDQLLEAQAIIDEADYLNLISRLSKTLDFMVKGLEGTDRDLNIMGNFLFKLHLLTRCYAPRLRGIIGTDLINSRNAGSHLSQNSMSGVENTAPNGQNDGWSAALDMPNWPLPNLDPGDGTGGYDDAMWTSVLEGFI